MSNPSIKELVDRLRQTMDAIDWIGRDNPPRLRKAATAQEIEALEASWGRDLPPSYKEFLKLANGMEGADQYDWAIAGATAVSKGESFEDVRSGHLYVYKDKDPNHPAVADLESAHVIGSDFDYQVAYWDPKSLDQEEPMVRRVGMDTPYDHYPLFEDFRQFLEFVVAIYDDLLDFQQDDEPLEDGLAREQDLLRELAQLLESAGGPKSKGGGAREPEPEPEPEPQRGGGLEGLAAALLGGAEPEPEPEPELDPEMQLAHKLCHLALDKLLAAELVELVDAPKIRENLEDYLLRKLLRSRSPEDTMEAWIYALSKAREVEELWGTDDELKKVMAQAFEEVSREKEDGS